MRNMSFSLTTQQMRDRTKTVTRRLGWGDLKPGDRVCAVVKGMGLKKGEKVERICVIEIVSNLPVMLCQIPLSDVMREGFKAMSPADFVTMFRTHNRCEPTDYVNRIAFKYVEVQHG